MTESQKMAANIIGNLDSHIVDRKVKMDATVEVMVGNYEKQLERRSRERFELGNEVAGPRGKLD